MTEKINKVEALRHLAVFSPESFGSRRIDIIGAGATGSRIALALAKLGVSELHVWDFDTVEAHNVGNQVFGNDDIGKPKVVAMAEMIARQTGLAIEAHNERVTGSTALGQVVFMLTDTMASRKEIYEGAIRYRPSIELMVETRMGADAGRVYAVRPTAVDVCKAWEKTLCKDEEASDSLCGARTSVGPTAEIVSGMAVWQFIRWFAWYSGKSADQPEFEVLFSLRPFSMLTR